MKQITTVKKVTTSGHSVVINITKEAEALEVERGDYLEVTLKVPQDQD